MSSDPTESVRRVAVNILNSEAGPRKELEDKYGQVWNTKELQNDYITFGFLAPMIIVKRKSDSIKGTLFFQHSPRYYWGFEKS